MQRQLLCQNGDLQSELYLNLFGAPYLPCRVQSSKGWLLLGQAVAFESKLVHSIMSVLCPPITFRIRSLQRFATAAQETVLSSLQEVLLLSQNASYCLKMPLMDLKYKSITSMDELDFYK